MSTPTTIDGVQLVDGMTVFERDAQGNTWRARVEITITATNRPWLALGDVSDDIDPTKCYSSREAAEKAGAE